MDIQEEFPNYPKDGDGEFAEVMEPYALWHISVRAEVGAVALWDMNYEPLSCEEYGPYASLDDRFSAWAKKVDVMEMMQFETSDYTQHHVPLEYVQAFYDEGLKLCEELAETLRGKCRTIDYRCPGGPSKRFLVPDPPEVPAAESQA
jgi:hypothetical protein